MLKKRQVRCAAISRHGCNGESRTRSVQTRRRPSRKRSAKIRTQMISHLMLTATPSSNRNKQHQKVIKAWNGCSLWTMRITRHGIEWPGRRSSCLRLRRSCSSSSQNDVLSFFLWFIQSQPGCNPKLIKNIHSINRSRYIWLRSPNG